MYQQYWSTVCFLEALKTASALNWIAAFVSFRSRRIFLIQGKKEVFSENKTLHQVLCQESWGFWMTWRGHIILVSLAGGEDWEDRAPLCSSRHWHPHCHARQGHHRQQVVPSGDTASSFAAFPLLLFIFTTCSKLLWSSQFKTPAPIKSPFAGKRSKPESLLSPAALLIKQPDSSCLRDIRAFLLGGEHAASREISFPICPHQI